MTEKQKPSWYWMVPRVYFKKEDAEERAERLRAQFPEGEFKAAGNPKSGYGVQRREHRL